MSALLDALDEVLGTAPPLLGDGAPSQRSRLIARLPAGDLRLAPAVTVSLVAQVTEREHVESMDFELEVWIVDDACGPRVALLIGAPGGEGESIEVDAKTMEVRQ